MAVPLERDEDIVKWNRLYEGSSVWLDTFERGIYPSFLRRRRASIEKRHGPEIRFPKVIEVGCGTGIHPEFVKHGFESYVMCDLSSEHIAASRKRVGNDPRFSFHVGDTRSLPDASFDRLISIDTLEHIYEPWNVVQEWARVVKPGGVIDLCIPAEGGLAWRLARHLTTRRTAVNEHKLDYDFIIATEHVNSSINLISVVRHYFPNVETSLWPLGGLIDMNLFVHMSARKP